MPRALAGLAALVRRPQAAAVSVVQSAALGSVAQANQQRRTGRRPKRIIVPVVGIAADPSAWPA